jgi:BirA family biotin operon repressor/biotin-[acetyl-CoA-carboxylase] ligase
MPKPTLLTLLADGEFHSDQQLAVALGISPAAVGEQFISLRELGINTESEKQQGYRVPGGLDLLDAAVIVNGLGSKAREMLSHLQVDSTIDSTNAEVLRRMANGAASGLVCTAEQQLAGRGRRGREWVSPFAGNLYLSVGWHFTGGAATLEGLSLAVGVAVAAALEKCGVPDLRLKWPNDLLHNGEKLGGILVEMAGDATGHCQVVVGVGINVRMPAASGALIDQSWTDIDTVLKGSVARSVLLAAVLEQLLPLLPAFEEKGFTHWRDAWLARDAHAGQAVVVATGEQRTTGLARGVDHKGNLLLETESGVREILGGEVSLRSAG